MKLLAEQLWIYLTTNVVPMWLFWGISALTGVICFCLGRLSNDR